MGLTEIDLKDYQKKAVEEMFSKIENLISMEHKKFLLEAPTGAGKTIIIGEFLKKWIRETEVKLSFVWLAPRKLHTQSKQKFEDNLEVSSIKCSQFENISENKIKENEIYFENWESLHQLSGNIIVRENESGNYLEQIIQNTKNEGRKVVVIIDESHRQTRGPQTRQLLEIINPDLSLEITATPDSSIRYDDRHTIQRESVIEEEMIKKNILINPKITNRQSLSNEDVIKKGIEKRKKLSKQLDNESQTAGDINPLLLIQIPKSGQNLNDLKTDCEQILKDQGITYENRKLALYLAEKKKNLDDTNGLPPGKTVEDNDSNVEVMIFKEAIALGWDCPRAHILLLFREHIQLTFGLQTIGRIMRMPEQKHYDKSDLNSAYIYTNLPPFDLEREYVKGYVSEDISERDDKLYTNIELNSIFIKRQREKTRLSRQFNEIFNSDSEIANEMKSVDLTADQVKSQIIKDGIIENYDEEGKITSGIAHVLSSYDEVDEMFKRNLLEWCGKFAPFDSHGRIRTALYNFMKENHTLDYADAEEKIRKILLSEKNLSIVDKCIKIALEKYEKKINVKTSIDEIELVEPYEIPETIEHFGQKQQDKSLDKSIMKPFFVDDVNQLEYEMIKAFNKSDNVKWWFKSKEKERKYFGILWKDSVKKQRVFYLDYIVQFEDGSIGLFDTKSGLTLTEPETKLKAKSLEKYIKKENEKRKKNKLTGGIVTNTDSTNYSGLWKINTDAKHPFDSNKITDWDNMSLST